MKLLAVILFLLPWLPAPAFAQEGPDDQYVGIYGMIQQADTLALGGQPREALVEYQSALEELQKFQKIYPDWGTNIVRFRLQYLSDKIAATAALLPAGAVAPVTNSAPAEAVAPAAGNDAALEAQLADLRSQLQNLQSGNANLEARLKEALTVQPAAVDPRELAAAQEKVRELMKENDLLRVSLIESKTPAEAGVLMVDSNALASAQRDLADLGKKLELEVKLASRYSEEDKGLREQIKSLQDSSAGVLALHDENVLLKQQLAEARAAAKKARPDPKVAAELKKAQAKIAALEDAARVNSLEKAALEDRVRQLELAAAHPDSDSRIKELEQERDSLKAGLAAAKSAAGKKSRGAAAEKIEQLTQQVQQLQARLAVDEAQPVPYTEEELALFRQIPPAPVEPTPAKPAATPLSPESIQLVASARTHFAAGEYDQAASDYRQILQHDVNNGLALANLATIELQEGHFTEAETNILAALALSPNDAFNLSVLGNLRFQQGRIDDALDVLSRAAKLDPQSPAIENYLGMALGQKGLRLQAETALRKALVLDPDYAPAQNNLAVVYISEDPPRAELARWHYLKALAAGQPRNPGLEKLLSDNGAAVPAQ